ncbi:HAD hydrolase family protein [Streptomyces sp. WMMC500]|uniref:HAD family hydrolase n=1 Tax=Streptomyces sp. WMMC500 TaxID=3015154 RepID=UPI00248CEA69|nr:HAD hydrolase family protein [Streptomyces sp. WMMC500]WBB64558.1 HAD hydrolase family protein [Streptomyces sp. WMMC500]
MPPPVPLPRLIATDLDGTLLRDDKTVSGRTVAALAAAEEAGLAVVFVTGRPARWMGLVAEHVHGHGMAICANGAAVVDLHRGLELVEVCPLPLADAVTIVGVLRTIAPGTAFAVEHTGGFGREPGYPLHRGPGPIAPVEKLLAEDGERAGDPLLKLLAYHPDLGADEFLRAARAGAGAHGEFTRSTSSALLEVSGLGVSKASTLARYCGTRGIAAEEVVAFGDMPNDLEMLTWAGRSYAMANAHPEVLAATTDRTAANEEDGVALVIEQLLQGR